MPVRECNFLIVGTGIAGASAAYHLAGSSSVILLERESQPGYHSTGRSAAVYAESYGPRLMRGPWSFGEGHRRERPNETLIGAF